MTNPEASNELRQQAVLDSLHRVYKVAQQAHQRDGKEEYIHVGLTRYTTFRELPSHLQQLISRAEIPESTEIRIGFGHYKAYEKLKPSFSFGIGWERGEDSKTVNNHLHLAVYEEPEDELVHGFFPSDTKTAYQSSGPHVAHFPDDFPIDLVPDEMKRAVTQKNQMQALMNDQGFQFAIVEELVELFK